MARLAAAGDGWINLRPERREEDEEPLTPRPGMFAFLGGRQPVEVISTWMPARPDHHRPEVTLGILHPQGRGTPAKLAAFGLALPAGWRVTQDHTRRGLILKGPAETDHAVVLDWVVRASQRLSLEPGTGRWRAEVFPPTEPG
jgi:hypothetical protein